ncbi:MAG: hypothetical protein EOM31_10450 [Bacteroidia bacterium]|nr:hypothetical protein [Bacteroidia bacterium]
MSADNLAEILADIEPISQDIQSSNQDQSGNATGNKSVFQLLKDEEEDATFADIDSILEAYGTSEEEVLNAAFGSEFEVSRLLVSVLGGLFCKNLSTGEWMKFNGVAWVKDLRSEMVEYVDKIVKAKVVRLVYAKFASKDPKSSVAKALHKLRITLSSARSVNSLRELTCTGSDGLGVPGEHFDSQLRYIGAPNGTIDLETGSIIPGDPNLYITRSLGFSYNPLAPKPIKFLTFLNTISCYTAAVALPEAPQPPIMPNEPYTDEEFVIGDEREKKVEWVAECERLKGEYEQACANYQNRLAQYEVECSQSVLEVISFIQRLFGYILTGTGSEHIFVVFHGAEGRNGKGVLVRILMKVLGNYGGEVRPELLVRTGVRNSSSPTPDILDLMGKRFVVASETNQGEFFDTSVVKRLTGGDTVVGRALYGKHEVRFCPSHTIGLQTNFTPNAPAEDTAFWARLVMIKFNRVFVETPDPTNIFHAKINKNLESELLEEGESILKWLIDGVSLYAKDGLNPPQCILDSRLDYKERTDLIGDFLEECCVKNSTMRIKCSEIPMVVNKWCSENGYKTMNKQTIRERLERRGIKRIKSSDYYYDNLDWSPDGLDIKMRALNKAGEQF